jgi:zinc-ribbon domain
MRYCTRCGHAAEDTTSFCISCGAPLTEDDDPVWDPEPAPVQPSGPPAGPAEPPPPGQVRLFGGVPETGNVRIITPDPDPDPYLDPYLDQDRDRETAGQAAPAAESASAGAAAPPVPGVSLASGGPPALGASLAPGGHLGSGVRPAAGGSLAPGRDLGSGVRPAAGGSLAPGTSLGCGTGRPGAEPGEGPDEDTASWLPGLVSQAPALTLPLRRPPRPAGSSLAPGSLPPRRPLVLPVPSAAEDGDLTGPVLSREPDPDQDGMIPAWLKAAVAAVVVTAGLTTWYVVSRPHPSSLASSPSAGHSAQARLHRPSSGTTPARGRPVPPRSRRPAVRLGPGVAGQSAARPVAAFVAQYFAAINGHDYPAFSRLFEPGASPVQSAGEFRSGYRSSRDSRGRLVALAQAADGTWAASLTFRSHQDAGISATGTSCTAWGVTLYLVPAGGSYLIAPPPPGYRASAQPCP